MKLAICPNFSHPSYKRAEKLFGEDNALLIYEQLGDRIPSETELDVLESGRPLSAKFNQRVWDVNKAEDLIERWHTVDGVKTPIMRTFLATAVENRVLELRKKYYRDGFTIGKGTPTKVEGRWYTPIIVSDNKFVGDLNELHELHITRNLQRVDVAAEQAAINAEAQVNIDEEGNVLPQVEQSRRLQGIPTERITEDEAARQMTVFQKSVPYVQQVIPDRSLMTIAVAEAGGRTIRYNPDMITKDSIGHEFGHILIDLLGGMSNSMIRVGREQLKGTDIERAVMAAYPDLVARNDERIDKEILTTAVGLKAAELFKEQELQNKWTRWVVRFMRRLRTMFGIESSVVLKLAEKLVSGTELQTKEKVATADVKQGMFIQGKPSHYDQYSRKLNDSLTIIDKMLEVEEKLQSKAALMFQKKADVLSKKGKNTKEYQDIEAALPRIQGTNPTKSLIHMIRFAVESTKAMNDQYIAYLKQERYPKEGNKEKFTVKLLSEWRTSVAAWDMLEELKQLYVDTRDQVSAMGEESDQKALKLLFNDNKAILQAILGEKEFKALTAKKNVNLLDLLIPMLDEAINVKNTIQKLYVEKGKELIVDYLFPYVNHVKVIKREEYEKEWLALDEAKQKETPRGSYIMKRMTENMAKIEEDTRDLILRELGKAEGDVGFLTRYVDTILDSKDVISSALARAVFDIHEKSNREAIAWKYKFVERLTALEKQLGRTMGMPDEKFWDWILEEDPDKKGRLMQTIISDLPSKLIEDYWLQHEIVWSENYRNNKGDKVSDEQKGRILRKWQEEHAPRDREAWLKAQEEVAEEMHKAKIITEKEKTRFISNSKVRYSASRLPLTKIFRSQDAVDIMDSFYRRNQWTFRTPSGYYKTINTKWTAFEAMREKGLKNGVQTDERVKFYDFIQEVIDEAAARLPGKYALVSELPSMMKGFGQRYRATGGLGMSKADFLKHEFSAKFQKKSTDVDRGMLDEEGLNAVGKEEKAKAEGTENSKEKSELVNEAGEPVYFLPIYYTQNKTHDISKKLSLADQSFDVASLYFNYLKMAIDFGNKYEALAELEMTNYFINNRDVIRRDAKGNIVVDATAKKLRKVGEKLRDKAITDSGQKSMLAAQVNDFMKMAIYGMEHDEEPDINIFGFTLDRAKFLDNINRFTALNLLGMNFIAGIANINVGEINQLTEAFAGQYATMKNLKDATGYYFKNLGGMVQDIGLRRPTNIISVLNDRFNTLNEEIDGKINLNSRFANLMKTNTLFFTSHVGEHYMQVRFMLAMLKNLRAYDKEGNDLGDMLSQLSVDEETGTMKVNEKVANFDEQEQNNFSARMHRVLSSMHGEYTQLGQAAIQRMALGRMTILFRRFVVPGFKRRWGAKQINNLLDDSTEGYYRTFGRFAKQFMTDLVHFRFEAMQAYGSKKMTTLEKANLARLSVEVSAFIVTLVLCGIAMKAKKDDPDKDEVWLNNLAYQALRLRSEISFYVNPMATMQILRSPMASMSILENSIKLFGQIVYPITSGTFKFQVYQVGRWKGHLKLTKTINNIIPIEKQYSRILDIGDQLSYFNQ